MAVEQASSDQAARDNREERPASSRRTKTQWLKALATNLRKFLIATWLDWIMLAKVGAVAAAVWVSEHHFTRLFPITAPSGEIYWPEIAYPYVEPIFSSAGAGVLCAGVPIAVFAIAQVWFSSSEDFASAFLGLSYSMVTGTCFQVILKKTIGGLRPHFLAVCKPVLPPSDGSLGTGFHHTMYTASQVCTGDPAKIQNALESFPSGHAVVAFAGFGYLAIYLFTHLRNTSICRQRTSYLRMLMVMQPLLFATYLSATLVLGCHHHSYDVIFGALVGSVMALLGYRMVFMGLFDPRWNTVSYLKLSDDLEGSKPNSEDRAATLPNNDGTTDDRGDSRSPATSFEHPTHAAQMV